MNHHPIIFLVVALMAMNVVIADSGTIKLEQLDGIWARKKYVDALASMHSQFAEGPESITISASDNRLYWTNYHEGSWRHIFGMGTTGKSSALIVGDWEVEPPQKTKKLKVPFTMQHDAEGNITGIEFLDASLVSYKKETFIKLTDTLQHVANHILLAGTYQDADGRAFIFTENGMAWWPEAIFPYELTLDSSEAGCDYFQTEDKNEPGERKRYGFKWAGADLQLFRIVYDRNYPIQCEDPPFVTLIRQ